jgi:hypothetical protein
MVFSMSNEREPRLGVDIGRVIIDGSSHPQGGDTAFFQGDEDCMLATPEMDGAFDAIARLTQVFDGRVWLVSKCGERVQGRTERWLRAHRFFEYTSIADDHVRFCRARPEKRIHCVELGLTHFVDDRVDVHEAIRDVVDHQVLFGPQRRPAPSFITPALTWAVAEASIRRSVGASSTATA